MYLADVHLVEFGSISREFSRGERAQVEMRSTEREPQCSAMANISTLRLQREQ